MEISERSFHNQWFIRAANRGLFKSRQLTAGRNIDDVCLKPNAAFPGRHDPRYVELRDFSGNRMTAEYLGLAGVHFVDASLSMARLERAHGKGLVLRRVDLSHAVIEDGLLHDGDWREVDLTGTSLRRTGLRGTKFAQIDFLKASDLSGVDFSHCKFDATCTMDGVDWAAVRSTWGSTYGGETGWESRFARGQQDFGRDR